MGPRRLFPERHKNVKVQHFSRLEGTTPVKLLDLKFKQMSVDRFPIEDGMVWENLLLFKLISTNFKNFNAINKKFFNLFTTLSLYFHTFIFFNLSIFPSLIL